MKVFENGALASRYDNWRALPPDALADTLAFIDESVVHPTLIVDLGCGTGRFIPVLADRYGGATILGLEPATAMISVARARLRSRVHLVRGDAETMPLQGGSADLVYASMILHHLWSLPQALRSISRVLRPGGVLVVRNATAETRAQTLHVRFFPDIADLAWLTIASRREIEAQARAAGLEMIAARAIPQVHARTYGDYYKRIAERPLSDLITISDEAFAAGCAQLRIFCEPRWADGPVTVPIDHLAMRKVA